MNQQIFVKKVKWQDLVKLSRKEMWIENTITLPWVIASWTAAWFELYWLAAPFSVMLFLTALRQVHNGFHNALGIGRKATWFSLYLNSILMMASIHAVKFNHLRHHKYCLKEGDYEGHCAKLPWYKALLYGPVHMWSIHRVTIKMGNRFYKRDTIVELISVAVFTVIVFAADIRFLIYHCIAMSAGEMLSAFFAVWTVHHDLEEHEIARTQRTGWKNFLTYNMFYHLEHHLFPAVPTIKLPELARRIDEADNGIKKRQTF
ncbi:MAG: fatty acid desaturase [Ferruginibacter sp.]